MTTATQRAAESPSATQQFDWIRAELRAEYAPEVIEAAIGRFQQKPPTGSMTRPAFLNAIRYHCKNLTPKKIPIPAPEKPQDAAKSVEASSVPPVPDARAQAESAKDFEKPRRLSWHGEVTGEALRAKAAALVRRASVSPKAGYGAFCLTQRRLAAINGGELAIGKLPAADRYDK